MLVKIDVGKCTKETENNCQEFLQKTATASLLETSHCYWGDAGGATNPVMSGYESNNEAYAFNAIFKAITLVIEFTGAAINSRLPF